MRICFTFLGLFVFILALVRFNLLALVSHLTCILVFAHAKQQNNQHSLDFLALVYGNRRKKYSAVHKRCSGLELKKNTI